MSKELPKLVAFLLMLAIVLSTASGLSVRDVHAVPGGGVTRAVAAVYPVDLSTYVRVGRSICPNLRTDHPPNSLLAQEASGVTYNWDTDTLFVVGDAGTSVVQVTKTGRLINVHDFGSGFEPSRYRLFRS